MSLDADEARIDTASGGAGVLPDDLNYSDSDKRALVEDYIRHAESTTIKRYVEEARLDYYALIKAGKSTADDLTADLDDETHGQFPTSSRLAFSSQPSTRFMF